MYKEWKAKWVMDRSFYGLTPINLFHKQLTEVTIPDHKKELKNRHMLVRKKFNYITNIDQAYIDITADDYYKLYVNGEFTGQGPAQGYYFNYNYNRYDLSKLLKRGENIIAVHVYYQGLVNRVWNSGDYRQGLIAELFINNDLRLSTDSTWKYIIAREYSGTPSIGYETQYTENIDHRLKEDHWRDINYDDEKWEYVCENRTHDHRLVLQDTPNLQVYEKKPEAVKMLQPGHYFIDFGIEITGQFKMTAKGNSGQSIDILCGEELEEGEESKVRYNMRCNCAYKETITLSGREDVVEFYDYKAFRYVEVIAPENVVDAESFCAVVRHYPYDEDCCKFKSSSKLLNDIWSICRNGVKYGSQEVFVDCPSREKGQYLGDATVTAHSHLYLTGDLRLFKKELKDFARSSYICPGIMAIAPGSTMQEIADFSLQWPLQLLNYYKQSGDLDFLKEMLPIAEGISSYFKKYERADGLLENVKDKWNLVDWPDNLRDGYDFDLSQQGAEDGCHNVINAFYCGMIKTINEIKNILNITYTDRFPELKAAYVNAFYKKDKKLFADSTVSSHISLHSNIISLFYGLVPEDAISSIVELISKKRMCCGVYMAYFLLKGLANAGEYELLYELITSEDEHSWSNMIREGATACFEAWGKNQKWNTSLCHPWASSPIPVIIEDIIGLKPAVPGWKEISFTPHIPASLDFLELKLHVPTGDISMQYRNGQINLDLPREQIFYFYSVPDYDEKTVAV